MENKIQALEKKLQDDTGYKVKVERLGQELVDSKRSLNDQVTKNLNLEERLSLLEKKFEESAENSHVKLSQMNNHI